MTTEVLESDKNPVASNSSIICIVGPRRLQNELIASCLEREIGSKCAFCEDISHITSPDDLDSVREPRLVLCDYQGIDLKGLLAELRSNDAQKLAQDRVALFNVSRGHGIEEGYVWEAVRGIFYENDSLDLFLEGVRAIFDGELWLSKEIMTKCILKRYDQNKFYEDDGTILTRREVEILALVGVGARNDEVADKLCISTHTVKTHLYNIFKKISVPNRIQAALWAAKNL